MTFGATLGEHLMIAASAKMFYIAIYYKKKTYTDFWCPRDHCTAELNFEQRVDHTCEDNHKANLGLFK